MLNTHLGFFLVDLLEKLLCSWCTYSEGPPQTQKTKNILTGLNLASTSGCTDLKSIYPSTSQYQTSLVSANLFM